MSTVSNAGQLTLYLTKKFSNEQIRDILLDPVILESMHDHVSAMLDATRYREMSEKFNWIGDKVSARRAERDASRYMGHSCEHCAGSILVIQVDRWMGRIMDPELYPRIYHLSDVDTWVDIDGSIVRVRPAPDGSGVYVRELM